MFVSNTVHLHALDLAHETEMRVRDELAAARATLATLERTHQTERDVWQRAASAHEDTIAFLCARVNHLERTNAVLFKAVTDIDTPVPTMTAKTPAAGRAVVADMMTSLAESIGGGASMFEDMGDAEAKRQGIGWDQDGTVVHGRQPGTMEEPAHA